MSPYVDAWLRLNDDERLLGALAGLGMDSADIKAVDGRVTLWCGGTEDGLRKVRSAIPWVEWEMFRDRAAVVMPGVLFPECQRTIDPRVVIAREILSELMDWFSKKEPFRHPEFTVRHRVQVALEYVKREQP